MEKFETPPYSPPIIVINPDDQPMWSTTRIVAPTPSSAIVQLPIPNNFHIKEEAVMLRTFPFSLSRETKTWLNELDEGTITSWNELREAFVSRYFSAAKFKHILNEIHSFHQLTHETLVEAWLRIKEMLCTCYGHGLTKGTIIQIFYRGLDDPTQVILYARGIFLYNTPNEAFKILEDNRNNIISDHEVLMEKFKALATKIDSEFLKIRKELKEMRDGRRNNQASQIYMSDDTPMCDPMEANYVEGYHDGNSRNSTSTEEMMREWMARQTEANERMRNEVVEFERDVEFIEEDEIKPIQTMPNPNPIMSNSPTVSPFLKDCIVHIPYTNAKTFADVVLPNHVSDNELKSIDGVGNGVLTKTKIKRNDKDLLEGKQSLNVGGFDNAQIDTLVPNSFSTLEEDNKKLTNDLADDTQKKMEAPPKKTPRKTGIWSGRKADSHKRNVVFSSKTKVHYFDKDGMNFDDMGLTVEEVKHENAYSENG
ncbi:reverse transcriptase domain-containing protein [Tanacetum coccineum]